MSLLCECSTLYGIFQHSSDVLFFCRPNFAYEQLFDLRNDPGKSRLSREVHIVELERKTFTNSMLLQVK